MKRVLSIAIAALCLSLQAAAQQPNTNQARFLLGGFDNGIYPLSPPLSAPGITTFSFRGAANAPFTLAVGPLSPSHLDMGPIGLVDFAFDDPSASIWADGPAGVTLLDQMARLDAQGALDVTIPLAADQVGNLGTAQCLFLSPQLPAGWALSAANQLVLTPGIVLSAVTPPSGAPSGGTPVQIIGEGFIPGSSPTVFFGPNVATAATVTSPTTIDCLTPPGIAASNVQVMVVSGDLIAVLGNAFHYDSGLTAAGPAMINEVFTGSPDYVELLNPHSIAVDLSGYRLKSWYHGTTLDGEYTLPQGSVLQPGETLVIQEMGIADQPGTLPNSIRSGYNFFWVGTRQVEVALIDPFGQGIDYVTRRYNGSLPAPNLPADLSWSGSITGFQDAMQRNSQVDGNLASDFVISTHGTPGALNPGQ